MSQFDPKELLKTVDERIEERLKGLDEKISSTSKQDLGLYGNFTMREISAMQQKKALIEKLEGFSASEYGKMTVKELLTGTSNVALPTMVQARALLELKTWIDARDLCMCAPVAKGAGKTVETQVITEPTFSEWTEGSALSAADPTLAKRSITMKPFGKVTQISDLLANTSSVNFVEQIGKAHGSCVRQGIFQYVGVALSAGVGGSLSAASGSTLTFAEVASAIKAARADTCVLRANRPVKTPTPTFFCLKAAGSWKKENARRQASSYGRLTYGCKFVKDGDVF
jgi:hypothetical protein